VKLVPEAPYTLAARLGLDADREAAWDSLEPTSLFDARAEQPRASLSGHRSRAEEPRASTAASAGG